MGREGLFSDEVSETAEDDCSRRNNLLRMGLGGTDHAASAKPSARTAFGSVPSYRRAACVLL